MLKKNSGFSMVELLAAVVILGVLMMVAIPTVTNLLKDSKNKTYVDDSIRLVSTFEEKMRKDNMMPVPAVNNCIAINLTYLDNNTFDDAPYDGEYHGGYSFVVALREDINVYKYYVRLVEKLPSGEEGFRGTDLSEVDSLYAKDAKDVSVKSLKKSSLFDLSDYVLDTSTLKTKLGARGINCGEVIVYAPDRGKDEV